MRALHPISHPFAASDLRLPFGLSPISAVVPCSARRIRPATDLGMRGCVLPASRLPRVMGLPGAQTPDDVSSAGWAVGRACCA